MNIKTQKYTKSQIKLIEQASLPFDSPKVMMHVWVNDTVYSMPMRTPWNHFSQLLTFAYAVDSINFANRGATDHSYGYWENTALDGCNFTACNYDELPAEFRTSLLLLGYNLNVKHPN